LLCQTYNTAYTRNTYYVNALAHVIHSGVSGQCSYTKHGVVFSLQVIISTRCIMDDVYGDVCLVYFVFDTYFEEQ